MPTNKNALIRYKTIDNCLRNHYRKWTLEDLINACSDALYEMEGIDKGISMRTIQSDIQLMRSDKLGYNAPIEVYDKKYYRYSDPNYSITDMPLSDNEYKTMQEAVDILRQLNDFKLFNEISDIVSRLQDKLLISKNKRKPIIHFDSVPNLTGINYINKIYDYIFHNQSIIIKYQPFKTNKEINYDISPYLLKEYRNRWFLFGAENKSQRIINIALDRIKSINISNTQFINDINFNADSYFKDIIGVTKIPTMHPQKIKFIADKEQSNYIKTKPLHSSQRLIKEDKTNGKCIFEIKVIPNFEMYSTFMSYGNQIIIISPKKVVNYIKRIFSTGIQLYEG